LKDKETAKFVAVYPIRDPDPTVMKYHLIALDAEGVVWYYRQEQQKWFYYSSERNPGADASGSWWVVE